jgi:hypothetical protein
MNVKTWKMQPCKELFGKHESKDALGRPRRMWEDIVEILCEVVGSIELRM